ncbi:MAG: YqeG family HAD IIIA-type phosphatase [Coriobacteriia bacterium]|nr:YqeG family HAD IIIA-type phosphatase [Coriobacteriia bacterium]
MLRPDHYVSDVLAIDLAALAASGVKALLLDIDNTLLPLDQSGLSPEIASWIASLPDAGLGAYLVSNNWHGHIHARADEIGLPVIAKAAKPLPFGFRAAARALGVSTRECAVVGDQVFTDILGGRLAGATTVLVCPLSSTDLPHTLVLRRIERVIMAGRRPTS